MYLRALLENHPMKKLVLPFLLLIAISSFSQVRYIDEVFSDVTVTQNIQYATNITVLSGQPQPENLLLDLYEPSGDSIQDRPVLVFIHTGSFLPVPFNGNCTGNKSDSAVVEMCTQFAKRGFVVASIDYRLGWNPVGPQDTRTSTFVNAIYRGMQDSKAAVRYLRYSADSLSNPYKIDEGRISLVGQGSGGYIALAHATLDQPSEIMLQKFIDSNTGNPYIDTTISGNYEGTNSTLLNMVNNPNYSSDVCMVANLGGAILDSTWLEAGDVPMVGFHTPSDPFVPYGFGGVFVPTTGNFVIEVSGSYDVLRRADSFGNNHVFVNANLSDPYTQAANADNDGYEGLFPFLRPGIENAPWEWWNTSCSNNSTSILTNPDMSKAKALNYIDTIMEYLCPRIAVGCNLPLGIILGEQEQVITSKISPNPASDLIDIFVGETLVEAISIYDITGKLLLNKGFSSHNCRVDISTLKTGAYLVRIQTQKGELVQKLIVK